MKMDIYHIEEMVAELSRIDNVIPQIIKELSELPRVYAKHLVVNFSKFNRQITDYTNNFEYSNFEIDPFDKLDYD